MEALAVLIIPIVIAYFVAPIAAFVMALGNRRMINELSLRVADLDRQLAIAPRGGAMPSAPSAPPITEAPSPPLTPELGPPVEAPPEAPSLPPPASDPVRQDTRPLSRARARA